MTDDLNRVGKDDRTRVSLQKHELQHVINRFGISRQAAVHAIRAAGPLRDEIYSYIEGKIRRHEYSIADRPKGRAKIAAIRPVRRRKISIVDGAGIKSDPGRDADDRTRPTKPVD